MCDALKTAVSIWFVMCMLYTRVQCIKNFLEGVNVVVS